MSRAVYPFTRFTYPDGSREHRAYTRLPLRIRNPATRQALVTWGLVDTGADLTILPAEVAVRLGHKLKRGRTSITGGIEQTELVTYAHTFEIELLSANLKRTLWSTGPREFDCLDSNPPTLIGVEDFLCHFRLQVDYPTQQLELCWGKL
jgi:hypothetical protein